MAASLPDLSLTDWTVLGVVAELGPTHGWSVVRELAPDGPLGRIWTVSRPLVYRSVTTLTSSGLIEACGDEPGRGGPQRTIIRATKRGRGALGRWLSTPVDHVREVRSALLLKLAFLDRAGKPVDVLAQRQLEALGPVFDSVRTRPRGQGFEAVLARWRREQALSVQRFLRSIAASE